MWSLKNKITQRLRVAATANEIADIASEFGCQFSGNELKAASKENIAGVKLRNKTHTPLIALAKVKYTLMKKL